MSLVGNPRENSKGEEESARQILITCNSHKAEFYPSRLGKIYVYVSIDVGKKRAWLVCANLHEKALDQLPISR